MENDQLIRMMQRSVDQRRYHLLERQSVLYFLQEDDKGQQDLFCMKNEKLYLLLSGAAFQARRSRILSFELSPSASILALKVKDFLKTAPDYYLYRKPFKLPFRVLERVEYLQFLDDELFCYSHVPDLNLPSDVASLLCGSVSDAEKTEILLEAEDAFEMQPYYSTDRKAFFCRVLRDYYQNDELFIWEERSRSFRSIIPPESGRCFYLGSTDSEHICLCNMKTEYMHLIALPQETVEFEKYRKILSDQEEKKLFGPPSAAQPAALLRGGKLLFMKENSALPKAAGLPIGRTPALIDLEKKEVLEFGAGYEAFFSNMDILPESDAEEAFYFFCEPFFSEQSIWRVNLEDARVDNLIFDHTALLKTEHAVPARMCRYSVGNSELLVYSPHEEKAAAGLLFLSSDADSDLLMRSSLFNFRAPLSPWIKNAFYAELILSDASGREQSCVSERIEQALQFLCEKFLLSRKKVFLFESGFLNSFSLAYAFSFPERVGGVATYNLRTDYLHYEQDACGFMVSDLLGRAVSAEERQSLQERSPLEIAKRNSDRLSRFPLLLICNDDSILVPSIHSERLFTQMREVSFNSRAALVRISEQEEEKIYCALLAFLFKSREEADIDCGA